MSEPAPAPAPEPAPAPAPQPAPSPDPAPAPAPAPSNGDWRDGLEGDLKEFASRLASPHDAVKSAFELRKANGSMVRLPGKDAKPEDVAKFNKAIGAGENTDAYVAAFPQPKEGELTDTDKLVQSKVAEVLFKHHVPVAAASELHAAVAEIAGSVAAEQERIAVKFRDESEAALRKEMGADFDSFIEGAKRVRDAIGNDELTELLNTPVNGKKLGDHPALIRVFGVWGKRSGEMAHLGALTEQDTKSINEQIDEFYAKHPPGSEDYRRKQPELQALFAKLEGNIPIVGSQGRAA